MHCNQYHITDHPSLCWCMMSNVRRPAIGNVININKTLLINFTFLHKIRQIIKQNPTNLFASSPLLLVTASDFSNNLSTKAFISVVFSLILLSYSSISKLKLNRLNSLNSYSYISVTGDWLAAHKRISAVLEELLVE